MASPLLLRDNENVSGDMIQRILGSQFAAFPGISGIGTGFSAGGVGLMNKNWLGGAAVPTGHLAVTANGTTMVLSILGGWAVVMRDQGTASFDPRALLAELQASTTVTVTANATGSTRNDTVCLKIDLNTAPSADGSNLVSIVLLAGASGGGLANAPADGNLYLPIANVAVANGATSIAQANVTDKRVSGISDFNPYQARIHASAAQADSSAAFVIVNLDTVDEDPNGNVSTANHTYVCPAPGRYRVSGGVADANNTAGDHYIEIRKNGAAISPAEQAGATTTTTGGNFRPSIHGVVRCAVGDTLAIWTNTPGATAGAVSGGWAAFEYLGP